MAEAGPRIQAIREAMQRRREEMRAIAPERTAAMELQHEVTLWRQGRGLAPTAQQIDALTAMQELALEAFPAEMAEVE